MEIKLKPCPFCGGEAVMTLFLANPAVACTKCPGAIVAKGLSKQEARMAWNRRTDKEGE